MIPASKFLIEAAFFHCSPGVGCGHGALALIKSWGVFASWVKRFLGLKIARNFWSKLSWLYSLLIERIVNGWSLSAFSCIYLQTAQHVSLKWQWIKLKDEKGLSSFEVALHWFSIVQAVQVQPTAEVGFGGGFSSNFQMSTIFYNSLDWLSSLTQVDPRYGVKFNVLITSMQVGARIYMDMSAVVKPTSLTGLRWVPKAAVYMRWILQCVGLWQWPRVQLGMSSTFFGIEGYQKLHGLPAYPQRFLPLCV